MVENISDERVALILDNTRKDWCNIMKFYDSVEHLLCNSITEMPQEDRQKLVEAYNLYRAAPYDWYEKEDK